MSKIKYITRTGSEYSISQDGSLLKNSHPIIIEDSPIKYIGVVKASDIGRWECIRINDVKFVKFDDLVELVENTRKVRLASGYAEDGIHLLGIKESYAKEIAGDYGIECNNDMVAFGKVLKEKMLKGLKDNVFKKMPANLCTSIIDRYV